MPRTKICAEFYDTAVCPYYTVDSYGELYCEGGKLKFKKNVAKAEFIRSHCANSDYKHCCICKSLDNYYETASTP